ncbi:Rieske [2Fe-2S] iron-sulfur domain-containing protein [Annulohypoxylon bovei var. microspora]|nr:Rieske [2Fe-2S] iron-sulfur domain-containing protein [Annulohypoxylon bovei var. microspora]
MLLQFMCIGALLFALLELVIIYVQTGSSSGTPTGLDAVEKGDTIKTSSPFAEHVPYDLEKRAIFLKRWTMVAHESQFKKSGDYRTYVIADIPFLIIRSKDDKLRAFHNVCRHRAYTVARRPCGNTAKLSCRYHGWQYSTAGELIKAPEFMDVPGFDKSANGLFEVHLKIDCRRFVFVNFATDLNDAFPWSDTPSPVLGKLSLENTSAWEIEVDVGWRIASLLPWFIDPVNFTGKMRGRKWLAHTLNYQPQLEYVDDGSFICRLGNRGLLIVSALPVGYNKTLVKNTFVPLGPTGSQPHDLQALVDAEISGAVARLKKDKKANTLLDFRQSAVRERLDKFARHIDHHRRLERVAGRKINAAVRVTGHDAIDEEAEALCNALGGNENETASMCMMEQGGELEW